MLDCRENISRIFHCTVPFKAVTSRVSFRALRESCRALQESRSEYQDSEDTKWCSTYRFYLTVRVP